MRPNLLLRTGTAPTIALLSTRPTPLVRIQAKEHRNGKDARKVSHPMSARRHADFFASFAAPCPFAHPR